MANVPKIEETLASDCVSHDCWTLFSNIYVNIAQFVFRLWFAFLVISARHMCQRSHTYKQVDSSISFNFFKQDYWKFSQILHIHTHTYICRFSLLDYYTRTRQAILTFNKMDISIVNCTVYYTCWPCSFLFLFCFSYAMQKLFILLHMNFIQFYH